MCRSFPWIDAFTGERYEYDVDICGEFAASEELIQLQRAVPVTTSKELR
ncbi:MAG TPA: hypothetical protein VM099_04830 [Gemmatimonadaceae bacterium]|nr:hypothetical protein [Gemmatimonadaceae bacterium]